MGEMTMISNGIATTIHDDGSKTVMPVDQCDNCQEWVTRFGGLTIRDANDMVSQPVQSQLFADIPASKMQKIKLAKKIRIKTKFNTPGGNRYKIYSTYKFGVKLKGNFVYEQGF